jgi:hypothetical protein
MGNLPRVKQWFDESGAPALRDVENHYPCSPYMPKDRVDEYARQWGVFRDLGFSKEESEHLGSIELFSTDALIDMLGRLERFSKRCSVRLWPESPRSA